VKNVVNYNLIKFSIKSDLSMKIFLKRYITWSLCSLDLDT